MHLFGMVKSDKPPLIWWLNKSPNSKIYLIAIIIR